MYNLLIALGVGILLSLALKLAGDFSILASVLPGVIAFIGAYVALARRTAMKVQALVGEAQKELSVPSTNKREQAARVERAVKVLESGLVHDKWQFLIGPEIHAQIGMIHYMVGVGTKNPKDFEAAQSHLSKANDRNYMARAMEGALHFQKKDYARMERSFEAAVKNGKKDSIVWAAYAWCLVAIKEKDKAMRVLGRGVEANPSDEKLKANLTALQNDKRMKMKAYEPMWWQFGLESPPQQFQGGRQVRFQRN